MSVYKTERGKWRASYNRVNLGTFDTKAEARRAEADHIAAGAVKPSDLTVAELRTMWLRHKEPHVRASTFRQYSMQTARLAEIHGSLPAAKFTARHAADWNVEHHWTIDECKRMFLYGVDLGVVRDNPFRALKKRPSKRNLKSGWVTLDGVNRLADAARAYGTHRGTTARGDVWAALVLTSAWTGIRPGEAFGLRLADVDFDAGLLSVQRSVDGKSGAVDLTKNGEERTVVISEPALDAIRVAVEARPMLWPGIDPPALFPNQSGKVLRVGSWGAHWRVIRAKAGFDGMDYYELRHFAATQLLEAGVAKEDVAHQLGHKDGGRLVMSVYGSPDEKFALQRIQRAMADLHSRAA